MKFKQIEPPSFSQQMPKISNLANFKEEKLDFVGLQDNSNSPACIRREGMLKIRDIDQKDKDVALTYAILTKDRLSYFVNLVTIEF